MKLIVGLGNPGKQYEKTRHNFGFLVVDAYRASLSLPEWKYEKRFDADICSSSDGEVVLMKPQTFMNLSGESVSKYAQYFKVDTKDIVVIYDDIDLPFGEVRFRESGSSAGQKGMQNIMDLFGTKDIARIRMGIAHDEKKIPTDAFVLQSFTKEEQEQIPNIMSEALSLLQG